MVGWDTYTWGIKDFHKRWSGSLAKRRLCLGPAGVINCTPLSALSFRVSLFPGKRGYNILGNKLTQKDNADSRVHFITLAGSSQSLLLAKDPKEIL